MEIEAVSSKKKEKVLKTSKRKTEAEKNDIMPPNRWWQLGGRSDWMDIIINAATDMSAEWAMSGVT